MRYFKSFMHGDTIDHVGYVKTRELLVILRKLGIIWRAGEYERSGGRHREVALYVRDRKGEDA